MKKRKIADAEAKSREIQKKENEKSTAKFVRNTCAAGVIIVGISCLVCTVCSLFAVLKPNAGEGSELMPLVAIVLSVWVGLNIYNIIGSKEIQLIHEQTEMIRKETDEADKVIKKISEGLAEAEKRVRENNERQKRNVLTALLSTISDNMEFYSCTSQLLKSFLNAAILDNTPREVIDLVYRIENTFSTAATLNRKESYNERIQLAEQGLKYCHECEIEWEKIPYGQLGRKFLKSYLSLRKGDFHYYRGYRIPTNEGKSALNSAVKEYEGVTNGIYELYAEGTLALMTRIENDNIADMSLIVSDEMVDGLLMQAYLCNIIGECNNVLSQYGMATDQNKRDASAYFDKVYQIYCFLTKAKSVSIPSVFAKYLRNYGTALEKIAPNERNGKEPDAMYLQALTVQRTDMPSYRTYASYRIKMLMNSVSSGSMINVADKKEILKVIDFLDIFITFNPTLPATQYLKGVAYLMLSIIDNSDEEAKRACRQLHITQSLDKKFKFDSYHSFVNTLRERYPEASTLLDLAMFREKAEVLSTKR